MRWSSHERQVGATCPRDLCIKEIENNLNVTLESKLWPGKWQDAAAAHGLTEHRLDVHPDTRTHSIATMMI